jgi:hypothetical protein
MSTAQNTMPTSKKNAVSSQGKPSGLISDYPISSVLIVFGIGLGAGVALGSLLSGSVTSEPTFGRRTELAAEHLGRQVRDAIAAVLPTSVAKHIGA